MIDGVIVDSIEAIVSLYNEDFQYYKNYKEIHPCEINTYGFEECNCASKEYINLYFNQPRFFERLNFMPYAKEVIEKLKDKYDVQIITMGFSPNSIGKQIWIHKNLPDIKTICIDMKRYKDKSHVDLSDGIFIDDKTNNLLTSNAANKILFGDKYSWNEDWTGTWLYNWTDVEKYLL